MSVYSFGGLVTHLGFGTLAVLLLWTTVRAYLAGWVPNLLWAQWYTRRTVGVPLPAVERLRVA